MGAAASASSQPNSTAMCDKCLVKFTLFKSKNKCMECEKNYCDDCFVKSTQNGRSGGKTYKLCVKCSLLISGNFGRNDLELYRVRDLQSFLTRRRVATDKCCQKEDLIELMLLYSKKLDPMYEDEPNHVRHVLELRERRILSDENLRRQAAEANSAVTTTSRTPSSRSSSTATLPPGGAIAAAAMPLGSTRVEEPTPAIEPPVAATSVSASDERPSSVAENIRGSGSHAPQVLATRPPAPASAGRPSTPASPARPPAPTTQPSPSPAQQPSSPAAAASPASAVPQQNTGASHTPDIKRVRLDDIKSEAAVDGLTIRQLKEILTNSYVDYKGCVERIELVTRVKNLWIDHQKNVQKAALIEAEEEKAPASGSVAVELCKVCMDAVIDCVLLDCGHMVTCTQCGKKMAECPICRQFVVRVVHVFRS